MLKAVLFAGEKTSCVALETLAIESKQVCFLKTLRRFPQAYEMTKILNSIVPGMGYNVSHDAVSTFAVKSGVITTHDFVVKGMGFDMIGDGRLLFLDDRLAFNIRLNAQGLPGVLLFPVSKLLEYTGTGTMEAPNWKPVLLEVTGRGR